MRGMLDEIKRLERNISIINRIAAAGLGGLVLNVLFSFVLLVKDRLHGGVLLLGLVALVITVVGVLFAAVIFLYESRSLRGLQLQRFTAWREHVVAAGAFQTELARALRARGTFVQKFFPFNPIPHSLARFRVQSRDDKEGDLLRLIFYGLYALVDPTEEGEMVGYTEEAWRLVDGVMPDDFNPPMLLQVEPPPEEAETTFGTLAG